VVLRKHGDCSGFLYVSVYTYNLIRSTPPTVRMIIHTSLLTPRFHPVCLRYEGDERNATALSALRGVVARKCYVHADFHRSSILKIDSLNTPAPSARVQPASQVRGRGR
jgi:hypothetical protein